MAIQMTIKNMKALLCAVTSDLDKAEKGNKAASQRVRTGTVKLEKIAKLYRKESISTEKRGDIKKPKKAAAKKAAAKPKKAAAKPKAKKAVSRGKALTVKRATAKLPFNARQNRW